MSNNKELWNYKNNELVWVGKYRNSQNLSHWHHDCELLYCYKGSLAVMCDKEEYTLNVGDSFFIQSRKLHSMQALENDTEIMIIVFNYNIMAKFASNIELESPFLQYSHNIPNIYNKLYYELTQKPQFYEIETKAIIEDLVIDILRKEACSSKKKNKKIDDRLRMLLQDLDQNFSEYTLDKAATFMGMNKSYFSRFFHTNVGISFARYLNCVKVENAVDLIHLNKDYQMTDIANICGFQTIRNFNLIMKEFTGYAPKNLPANYVFNGLQSRESDNVLDPTSEKSSLIEFSSPRY